jgi:acetyl-CoA C-acetyltransferase
MSEAVIVSAVRVPTGKFLGTLKDFAAPELGALVVREAVARAGIDPASVDECIMGNVVSAGAGQAPARQAALKGGLANHVAALTINKVCGSGLKAVMLAHQGIQTGDIEIAVAGGMESMSNAPYLLAKAREGLRMGNTQMVDAMIHDGLWCPFENWHMGNAGETVADAYKVTRDEQDAYAADSHKKAAAAHAAGKFAAELLPVPIKQKKGDPVLFAQDESVRAETTAEVLRGLKPAFKKDGSVTAGNAPPVNDGAAALVVMSAARASALGLTPLARIVAQATSGLEPKMLLESAGRRSLRAERGVRRAGGGRHPRARHRCRAGQRQRRRRGPGPPDRRLRRSRAHDAALRAQGSRRQARDRHALPGRRQRRRAGHRAALIALAVARGALALSALRGRR